ncbi:MAG: hypothetical protein OEQ18_17120, partial [Gammaproteobacteria bacterium]|nr:hypothetical protein [Gammaproteobacteria bacterium]
MRETPHLLAVIGASVTLLLGACSTNEYLSRDSDASRTLSNETILKHASAGPLDFTRARVISANDEAFLSKLEMVKAAKSSIDAAYYIYSDDSTSSALSSALIAAARRGVRVRLLLDYSSTYKDLDLFSMLEREGNSGLGHLEVRLYNRPTRNIVMDAAYLTLACGDAAAEGD